MLPDTQNGCDLCGDNILQYVSGFFPRAPPSGWPPHVLQVRALHDGMDHQGMHHAWKVEKVLEKCISEILSDIST
jgi:hypothetical protein